MNWPTRTTVLFIFSLFTLFSCEESTDLALEGVGSETELGTAYKDDFVVEASTVLLPDSILAYRRGGLLAGRVSNNTFGTVNATSFLEVGVGSSSFTAAAGAQIDSMVLSLDYNEAYGDTTQNLTLNVHRLQEPFKETETYYSFKSLTYNATPLGSVTFKPTPLGPSYVPVNGTAKTRKPTPVRIRLSNALAAEFLAQSGTTALSNQAQFVTNFPGIALTAGTNANSAVSFGPGADSTYLKIYYKSGGTKYTYQFNIAADNDYFTNIATDRAGTPLAALKQTGDSLPARNTNNQVFLQESTGLKTKISFPDLKNLKQQASDIAINRAELIIPAISVPYNTISPYVYFFETNKSNRILRDNDSNNTPRGLSDGNFNPFNHTSPAPGIYSRDVQGYKINITSYVQALLSNTVPTDVLPSQGLIISPASFLYNAQSGGAEGPSALLAIQTLRQTIINTTGDKRIMLRVYYTTKKP